jgi:membrane protease YdiL (CAAX protease family)
VKREGTVLALAMLYPSLLAYVYFVALAGPAGSPRAVQIAWAGGKAVQLVLPLVWVRYAVGRWPRPARPTGRGLAAGLASGLAVAAAMLLLYFLVLRDHPIFKSAPARVRQKAAEFGLDAPAAFVLFAALIALGHSLLEEYYWRWFIFGRLRCLIPVWAALVLSSATFMAFHVIDLAAFFPGRFLRLALPLAVCVGIGGAAWCWLYQRTGSLYAPWISHMVMDAAIFAVGYDLAFGQPR